MGCFCGLELQWWPPPPLLRLQMTHMSAFAKVDGGGYQENRSKRSLRRRVTSLEPAATIEAAQSRAPGRAPKLCRRPFLNWFLHQPPTTPSEPSGSQGIFSLLPRKIFSPAKEDFLSCQGRFSFLHLNSTSFFNGRVLFIQLHIFYSA